MNLAVGAKFQLLATKDMQTWTPVGEPFLAQTEQQVLELDVAEVGRFFQIQQIDEPSAMLVPEGFVRIPAGTFTMGSPETEKLRFPGETEHTVILTKDFYMSKYEVTQKEYSAVMGNNPSYFTTKDWNGVPISPDLNRPVEYMTWFDAMSYCVQKPYWNRSRSVLGSPIWHQEGSSLLGLSPFSLLEAWAVRFMYAFHASFPRSR